MTSQRSKSQIVTLILIVCQGVGVSKTQIVRQVNLNSKTVDFYLDLLTQSFLLETSWDGFAIYKTTAKGEMVLEKLRTIEETYS